MAGKKNSSKATVVVSGGLEEAEMYARFAEDMIRFDNPSESRIASIQAMIEKSRAILQRLIREEAHHG